MTAGVIRRMGLVVGTAALPASGPPQFPIANFQLIILFLGYSSL
jgi:hypothetical protein